MVGPPVLDTCSPLWFELWFHTCTYKVLVLVGCRESLTTTFHWASDRLARSLSQAIGFGQYVTCSYVGYTRLPPWECHRWDSVSRTRWTDTERADEPCRLVLVYLYYYEVYPQWECHRWDRVSQTRWHNGYRARGRIVRSGAGRNGTREARPQRGSGPQPAATVAGTTNLPPHRS